MKKKYIIIKLSAILSILISSNLYNSRIYAGNFKIITDMDDQKVEVPVNPKRIASMHCVSCERIYIFGKGDSMVLMGKQSPWAYKFYPEIRDIETKRTGEVKQIQDLEADLVLFTHGMFKGVGGKYRKAGIRTACAFSAAKRPRTIKEYISHFKRQIEFFGDILGQEAKIRTDKYCKYFDKKINQILARTSTISKKDRPSIYYGWKGGKMLYSQGKASVMHWDTEVAGGNYLPQVKDDNFTHLDRKDVLSWDPDIILISMGNVTIDSIKKDPALASKKAVKNNRIYYTPVGIYNWDNASGETPLFIMYLAKIFHPDLFKDLDLIKEMKIFYSEIYGKKITDNDAERILNCLPPL